MSETPYPSFTAIYVTPLHSRRVIHHEVFETTGMSPAAESERVRGRMKELEAQYPLEQHDISDVSYSSLAAIRSHHPELEIPEIP